MARNQVAIRLGVEGGAEVRRSFDEVGAAGERAAERLGRKFQQETASIERMEQQAAKTAARIAELTSVTPTQQRIAEVTGIDRQAGDPAAVRASAATLIEGERAMAAYQARAMALLESVDPLAAAQIRHNQSLAAAKVQFEAGALTAQQYATAQRIIAAEHQQAIVQTNALTGVNRMAQAGYQQLGYQISDVATMLSMNAPVGLVFATQANQIVQALTMIGGSGGGAANDAGAAVGDLTGTVEEAAGAYETFSGATEQVTTLLGGQKVAEEAAGEASDKKKGKMQAFSAFMGGPWGAVLIGGIALLGLFAGKLFETEETVESLTEKMREQAIERERQRQAEEAYALTAEGTIARMRTLHEEQQRSAQTSEERTAATLREVEEIGALAEAHGRLAEAGAAYAHQQREMLQEQRAQLVSYDALAVVYDRAIAQLKDQAYYAQLVAGAMQAVREQNEQTERTLRFGQLVREIEAEGDPTAQERLRNERRIAEIRRLETSGALGGNQEVANQLIREETQLHERNMKAIEDERRARQEAEREAERLQREAQRRAKERAELIAGIEAETQAAFRMANAYLLNSQAGLKAEAAMRAMNDARRLGIDLDELALRQLGLEAANLTASAARSAREMQFEAESVQNIVAASRDLAGGWRLIEESIEIDDLVRPLRFLQTIFAEDTRGFQELENAILAVTQAYGGLAGARAASGLEQALGRTRDEMEDDRALTGLTGDAARLERARIAAIRKATDNKWFAPATGGSGGFLDNILGIAGGVARGSEYVDLKVRQERDRIAAESIKHLQEEEEGRLRNIALLDAEHSMLGLGRSEREKQLRLIEAEAALNAKFGPQYDEQKAKILDLIATEEDRKIAIERTLDALAEIEAIGGGVIDELLDIRNWEEWGETGQRIIMELMQDLLRLAAINPLKNWLFGSDLPEIGGIFKALFSIGGSLAGGSGGGPVDIGDFFNQFPGNAVGTLAYPGGWSIVGESGPEIARFPKGTQISTAAETRRMLVANDNRIGAVTIVNHNDFRGADPAAVAAIEARQRQQTEQLYGQVVGIVRDAADRGMLR